MNIFILDTDPAIAASYHCDQHLHKMILESAQIVSTAMHIRGFAHNLPGLYKLAYANHPCTKWAADSNHNILWICHLAVALEAIRQATRNCVEHASSYIPRDVIAYMAYEMPMASHHEVKAFTVAMPTFIRIRGDLTPVQKYQAYYRYKHKQWLDTARPMTYKDRPIPPFMQDLFPA